MIMSEELNTEDKKEEIKKKAVSKKLEIVEQYKYIPEENEQLIMDKPSESLIKKTDELKPLELLKKEAPIMKIEQKSVVKSNKELYESYIKELKLFSLSINGNTIYDSSIDRSKESSLTFENDFFILYGKKYSYNGLKIQKINRK